jgi:hypothetical protein
MAPSPSSNPDPAIVADQIVRTTFARLNGKAWGIAFALLSGLGLLIATWALVLKGGPVVGPRLALLSNFLPGYSVTFAGGLIGFVYGFVIGYAIGRLIGLVYNSMLSSSS